MGKVIVTAFVTLDGVVEDPDGSGGMPGGGWAFRSGRTHVASDGFRLGSLLETGALLMGRVTWQTFAGRWPSRTGEFADVMNRRLKVVASRTAPPLDAWNNSSPLEGELVPAVAELARERDVIVAGSISVVHALAAADAVDEYRLLVMPSAVGGGARMFDEPVDLTLTSVEEEGEGLLARYARSGR
jgi:dihydrofolate reductase